MACEPGRQAMASCSSRYILHCQVYLSELKMEMSVKCGLGWVTLISHRLASVPGYLVTRHTSIARIAAAALNLQLVPSTGVVS